MELLNYFHLPDYSHLTPQLVLLFIIAGIFGALVRVAWLDKPIKGFYRDENGAWRMGFYGELIIAIAMALVIDGHPIRAGIAAVFAPFIMDAIREFLENKLPGIVELLFVRKIEGPKKDDE